MICQTCRGKGKVVLQTLYNSKVLGKCPKCGGSGTTGTIRRKVG